MGGTGTGTGWVGRWAFTQHENPYSVYTASWDLKIGERVHDTLRMSQQKFQVMVVRTFREKKKNGKTSKYEKTLNKPLKGRA